MYKIIYFFINRKITSFMVVFLFLILGIISFKNIPYSLMPNIEKKVITLTVRYPGQSPEKIERLILKPLEEAVSSISDIENISSVAEDGECKIYLTFSNKSKMKYKIANIRERILPVCDIFPGDVNEPEIYGYNSSDRPVIIISLSSETFNLKKIRDIAENQIKKKIKKIKGVAEVTIGGGSKREINLIVDEKKMFSHGLDFEYIKKIIQNNNFALSSGHIGKNKEYSLVINEKFNRVKNINDVPLMSSKNGSTKYIDSILSVNDYSGENDIISRIDGRENVSIYIMKRSSANLINLSNKIKREVESSHYKDIKCEIVFDQSEYINRAINNLAHGTLYGIIITIFILFLFTRSIWLVIPIALSIPFSFFIVFIYLYLSDSSINVITLSGLAIAAGLVVDNSIVILESITKNNRKAEDVEKNSVMATNNMVKSLGASTLTTLIIFIPIVLFNSESSNIFFQISGTVIIAIASSFLISITIIPSITVFILKKQHGNNLSKISKVNKVFNNIKNFISYENLMNSIFLNSKLFYIAIIGVLLLSIVLYPMLKKEFISPLDMNQLHLSVELPSGTNLIKTSVEVKKIEDLIKVKKYVKSISSRIEKGHGDITVKLKDQIINKDAEIDLKKNLKSSRKAMVFFHDNNASGFSSELDINIFGPDIKTVRNIARELSRKLSHLHFIDECILRFKEFRPEYLVEFKKDKISSMGLDVFTVGNFIRTAIYGPVVSKYTSKFETDIRLRLNYSKNKMLDSISEMKLISSKKKLIPLKELAEFKIEKGVSSIRRMRKLRMESITLKLKNNNIDLLKRKVDEIIETMNLSHNYFVDFSENLYKIEKENNQLTFAIFFGIILVYMVLAGIFESFLVPFVVLITIPVTMASVVIVLFISGNTLNISAYMGFIILIGIIVNNAILQVDLFEKYKSNDILTYKKLIFLAKQRIRPVLMTSITTASGMIPLIFGVKGSGLWHGFAITIFVGMFFSTLCAIFLIPVLYKSIVKV